MSFFNGFYKLYFLVLIVVGFNLWSMNDDDDSDRSTEYIIPPPKTTKRKLSTGKENATPRAQKKARPDDSVHVNAVTKSPLAYQSGNFIISPIKTKKDGGIGMAIRHYSIYAMIAVIGDDLSYVPSHKNRIKFSSILGEKTKIKDSNLDRALLKVETAIRGWIKKDPNLYYRTVYVGLAENASKRVQGHKSDLRELIDEDDEIGICRYNPHRKSRFIASAWNQNFNIRMSPLIYSIPEQYLPIVEVLVGVQFNVLSKGNSLLGNDAAWKHVAAYMKSANRKEVLTKLGLYDLVEKLDDQLLMSILNMKLD
jgi:hypothetical protein